MHAVVSAQRCGEYFDEAFGIVGSPAVLHLTILTEFRLGEVVRRVYTYSLKAVRTQFQDSRTVDMALTAREEGSMSGMTGSRY